MGDGETSTAAECLRFTALFEAEVLAQLMLDRWEHPLATDRSLASQLVDLASDALQAARDGTVFIEGLNPKDMSFIAAVWYVEWATVTGEPAIDPDGSRMRWLEQVRRTFPSCFCDPEDLL
jgi:hypothetical protein